MPPNIADGYIMLKPQKEWPDPNKTKDQLIEEITAAANQLPGNNYELSQPIQLRFNELISGVRSDLGVKIFGDNMDVLVKTGEQIANVLRTVPGNEGVKVEPVGGLPMLTIKLKREVMSRYGLSVGEVQEVLEAAIGGAQVGSFSRAIGASRWSCVYPRTSATTWMRCVVLRSFCRRTTIRRRVRRKLRPKPRRSSR